MNNKFIGKSSLILLVGVLCSCGYSLRELYVGDAYNSTVFAENYYRDYDSSIDPHRTNNSINSVEEVRLDSTAQLVATKYEQAWPLDPQIPSPSEQGGTTINGVKKLIYSDYTEKDDPESIGKFYGPTKKMSLVDEMFSYGYVSKLFDGQMFCKGRFQLARVQIDEGGFGAVFEKEVVDQTNGYFALSFKGADNQISAPDEPLIGHESKIDLHIGFYLRDGNGFKKVVVSYEIDDVSTSYSESPSHSEYTFFAFQLDKTKIDITRCAGLSVSYDLLDDGIYTGNSDIEHSLMLYEIMMPYTTWR